MGAAWMTALQGMSSRARVSVPANVSPLRPLERWEATGSAPSATIDVGDAGLCVIAEHGIACASDSGRIVFVSAETNAVTWSVQVPGWAGEMVRLAAMND